MRIGLLGGSFNPPHIAHRAISLFERAMEQGLGDHDVAAMVDVIGKLPRAP